MYKFDYRIRALSQAPRVGMGNKSEGVSGGEFDPKKKEKVYLLVYQKRMHK